MKKTASKTKAKPLFKVTLIAVTTSKRWATIEADAKREGLTTMQYVKRALASPQYKKVKMEYDSHDDTVNLLWTGKA